MAEHAVWVWDNSYTVSVDMTSEGAWVAVGEYNGELINVQDCTEAAALQRWHDLARSEGGRRADHKPAVPPN
jgi:hypothetical protein